MTKSKRLRFALYFVVALGWIWLYEQNPQLSSDAPFVYQDF